MRDQFEITCMDYPSIKLVTAEGKHNDLLSKWKNDNRSRFFFQETITPEMQHKWFEGYLDRPNDCMLMVYSIPQDEPVGCLAFRKKDGKIDLYNIIRGVKSSYVKMNDAMRMMLSFIYLQYGDIEIVCDVLSNNPAKQWYENIGFRCQMDCGDYYVLSFDNKESLPVLNESNLKWVKKC